MSLEDVRIKEELVWNAGSHTDKYIKEEPTCDEGSLVTDTYTKEESAWGVSAAAARAGLYIGHQVKGELVLGPELVQPLDKADAARVALGALTKTCKREPDLETCSRGRPMLRDCFVKIERLAIDKLVNKPRLIGHKHSGTDKTYICDFCCKKFVIRRLFVIHLRKHKRGKTFECNVCGRNFAEKIHLTRHSLVHVIDKDKNTCYNCNKQFVQRSALINHIRKHLGENTCQICHKTFASSNSLDRHKILHTGEKPFTCDMCQMQFRYKHDLVIHIREHTGKPREKPLSCDICNKQFSSNSQLLNHKRCHTGQKPFGCEICKRRFSATNNLKKHKLTHMKDRPFPCDVCNKQFVRKDRLIAHKLSHTGEKPFNCEICDKEFRYKESMVYHLRVHSQANLKPHSCNICGDMFRIKSHLTRHMRRHTGEKPFCCEVCKKSFREKSTLNDHMRMHYGEKPYGCDMCSKRYTKSSNLLVHKRDAHYLVNTVSSQKK